MTHGAIPPQSGASRRIVVMGVSGSGKSSIGEAVGRRLGIPYIDGDAYHPESNIDKMQRGQALDDDDRAGWLDKIRALIADYRERDQSALVGCSALKQRYRERLRGGDPALAFLFLDGSYALIEARMRARRHFFSPDLLRTQFDTLERPSPDEAMHVDIDGTLECVVERAVEAIRGGSARPRTP